MLKVRTTSPDYEGYKVSFAADTLNPQFKSFKANFKVPAGDDFTWVSIPFVPNFSKDWSPYTGDCDTLDPTGTQHQCCVSGDEDVCVTTGHLKDITQIGIWTEGHEGDFHLEIERIGAGNGSPPLSFE